MSSPPTLTHGSSSQGRDSPSEPTSPPMQYTMRISQTFLPVQPHSRVVGLCTVPNHRAGMEDLGWHIADFLAFRALICGDTLPKAQRWMSMCDIGALVAQHPNRYLHGNDKRLVGLNNQGEREDDKTISEMKKVANENTYPLVLIICGLTSLEQDIYFGEFSDGSRRLTLHQLLGEEGGGDENKDIKIIIITPSLFSAGWQINVIPSPPGGSLDLLAKQFGGLLAKDHVRDFLDALDRDKVNPDAGLAPGALISPGEVKEFSTALQNKIQSLLVGRFSENPLDHSFLFDGNTDDWEILMGSREKRSDDRGMSWYKKRWMELSVLDEVEPDIHERFSFLGNAFGGNISSQMNHIKSLAEESFLAWPDHWASAFGQATKKEVMRFFEQGREKLEWQEMFNILEHRATTSTMADMIVRHFALPAPDNQRCRDWNYLQWRERRSDEEDVLKTLMGQFGYGTTLSWIPGPNPPPVHYYSPRVKLQRRLESAANYVRASMILTAPGKISPNQINAFIREIQAKQVEYLIESPDIYQACCYWFKAIGLPIGPAEVTKRVAVEVWLGSTAEASHTEEPVTPPVVLTTEEEGAENQEYDARLGRRCLQIYDRLTQNNSLAERHGLEAALRDNWEDITEFWMRTYDETSLWGESGEEMEEVS
ncbi:hypothetical protein GGS20DRAFT_591155 [Poronia punctata]|nr:hypothetical protein GGS20DRAFT_591155 [Poronia punctata]